MPIAHQTGRRLAVLTGLCVALALGAATHVAAYPVTPDGEPLYLDPRAPQSSTVTPIEFGDLKRDWVAIKSSRTIDPLPATIVKSSGTDWTERRVLRRRRRKPCGAGPHRRCIRPERPPPSLGGGLLSERRSTVLDPDVQARRMLVRERHAELARDAFRAEAPEGVVRETRIRRRRRRAHLSWFRFHPRPARGGP